MHHVFYFAGPVFTEWYWAPVFFIVPTLTTVIASTSIVYAILFLKIVYIGKQKVLTKQARNIVLGTALLSLIASFFLYGGAIRMLLAFR